MLSPTEEYLGDGVYVVFDGYSFVLDLRGQDNSTKIILEPVVMDALDRFRKRIEEIERDEKGQQ